jgi:hypothetical protein
MDQHRALLYATLEQPPCYGFERFSSPAVRCLDLHRGLSLVAVLAIIEHESRMAMLMLDAKTEAA